MPRVLLLIPSASYRTADFMAAASRLGVDVAVGSDRDQVLAGLFPGGTLTADFARPEAGAETIARFADAYPLDAIVAVDDQGTVLAAHAAERLRLPHNAPSAVEAARNKAVLRRCLAEAGIPSPGYRVVPIATAAADADAAAVAETVPYPCVVKPLALSGSRGVIRADDAAAFVAAVARLRRILATRSAQDECGPYADAYLVEDFVPGAEVSLEGLLVDGALHVLALFDKPDPLDGPYFEETIYVTPSRHPRTLQAAIAATTEAACRALGIVDGPVHAELRCNADGVFPIDIAARTIGGLCGRTLRFGTGRSLEEIVLQHALHLPIASFEREDTAVGVMMIPIPQAGILRAVEGQEAARAVPGIGEIEITIPRGDVVVPPPDGNAYLGFIFARGETPEAVEQALRAAHARLRFTIEPIAAAADAATDAGTTAV